LEETRRSGRRRHVVVVVVVGALRLAPAPDTGGAESGLVVGFAVSTRFSSEATVFLMALEEAKEKMW
jgi:hypothetical protein